MKRAESHMFVAHSFIRSVVLESCHVPQRVSVVLIKDILVAVSDDQQAQDLLE
jgi:hypothetical protein